MNYFKKITTTLIIVLSSMQILHAQSTAIVSLHAKLIVPISIRQVSDMNFGNIATNGTGGTVTISTMGIRNSTGGITLPALSGTPSAAEFEVSGEKGYSYSISLSANTLQLRNNDNPSKTLAVSDFQTEPSGTGVLNEVGTQTLRVGATLTIDPNPISGTYTSSAPLRVTVNYN